MSTNHSPKVEVLTPQSQRGKETKTKRAAFGSVQIKTFSSNDYEKQLSQRSSSMQTKNADYNSNNAPSSPEKKSSTSQRSSTGLLKRSRGGTISEPSSVQNKTEKTNEDNIFPTSILKNSRRAGSEVIQRNSSNGTIKDEEAKLKIIRRQLNRRRTIDAAALAKRKTFRKSSFRMSLTSIEEHKPKHRDTFVLSNFKHAKNPNRVSTTSVYTLGNNNMNYAIDQSVNLDMLNAHLLLLEKFKALEIKNRESAMIFMLRAQERYLIWMNLINQRKFMNPPIPPLDVCLVWHAHLLSPLRYYEDMRRLYGRDALKIEFPLARLAQSWKTHSDHLDERSQNIWEKNTGKSWILSPLDKSDFDITCPWCGTPLLVPMEEFSKLMRVPGHVEYCPECDASINSETLSAKRFLDDANAWVNYKQMEFAGKSLIGSMPYISGTLVNPRTGDYSVTAADSHSSHLFITTSPHIRRLLVSQRQDSTRCEWPLITSCLKIRIQELKGQLLLKNLGKGTVERMISSYAGLPYPFSIDLISAILRQRKFTDKMAQRGWRGNIDILTHATQRYHKFILLTKKMPDACLVPTLDIDLVWHTHMLNSGQYRGFMRQHIKRIVNHDDTIQKSTLVNGFEKTAKAWYKEYNEPYTHEKPLKKLVSKKRNVITIVTGLLKKNKKKNSTEDESGFNAQVEGFGEFNGNDIKYFGACGMSGAPGSISGSSLLANGVGVTYM